MAELNRENIKMAAEALASGDGLAIIAALRQCSDGDIEALKVVLELSGNGAAAKKGRPKGSKNRSKGEAAAG